jgi:hypothetical protein
MVANDAANTGGAVVSERMDVGYCSQCERGGLLVGPLHGEHGGPIMCIPCGIEWHAKHARVRKMGRIVVKAIKAYFDAGGASKAIDRFKLAAWGCALYEGEADTIGAAVGDITSELLEDAVRLTHPDRHPPERQEAARRVTQELLALKPYVFPAPKPKESPPITPRNTSSAVTPRTNKKPLRVEYPCEVCADQVPYYYCKACRIEWEKRNQQERDLARSKRLAWYKARSARRLDLRPATTCPACKAPFKSKRKDAVYCSAACRQRAHRDRVTDKNKCAAELGSIRNAAAARAA